MLYFSKAKRTSAFSGWSRRAGTCGHAVSSHGRLWPYQLEGRTRLEHAGDHDDLCNAGFLLEWIQAHGDVAILRQKHHERGEEARAHQPTRAVGQVRAPVESPEQKCGERERVFVNQVLVQPS